MNDYTADEHSKKLRHPNPPFFTISKDYCPLCGSYARVEQQFCSSCVKVKEKFLLRMRVFLNDLLDYNFAQLLLLQVNDQERPAWRALLELIRSYTGCSDDPKDHPIGHYLRFISYNDGERGRGEGMETLGRPVAPQNRAKVIEHLRVPRYSPTPSFCCPKCGQKYYNAMDLAEHSCPSPLRPYDEDRKWRPSPPASLRTNPNEIKVNPHETKDRMDLYFRCNHMPETVKLVEIDGVIITIWRCRYCGTRGRS